MINLQDVDAFYVALQGEEAYYQQYPNCNWLNGDINGDGDVTFDDLDPFIALLSSGNNALAVTLAWDAENRLSEYRPTFPAQTPNAQKVVLGYDYVGRRVEKKVYNWVGGQWSATPALHRKFVWSGWLMLLELDGLNSDAVVRKYTWGLDLAGQNGSLNSLQGAGGTLDKTAPRQGQVGGLLAVYDVAEEDDYVYLHDANGNVGQVIDLDAASASAAIVAHYEYDPYGNLTASSGAYADDNPFRFSAKYFDAETGLGYWGYRYYSAALGRWLKRDPIVELQPAPLGAPSAKAFIPGDPTEGRCNLYRYVRNHPTLGVDAVGLEYWDYTTNQACCKFRETGRSKDDLPSMYLKRYQKTVSCPRCMKSPAACCNCHRHGKYSDDYYVWVTLDKAAWGICCWCTVEVVKSREPAFLLFGHAVIGNIGAHEKIVFKCDDGNEYTAQARGSAYFWWDENFDLDSAFYDPAYWEVIYHTRIDCECANRMINRIKKDRETFYIYLLKDCRNYARTWFRRLRSMGCYYPAGGS